MKHQTKDLLDALSLLKDSLHSLDFIPILSHCCFNEDHVYAYDDTTAVVVFYETGLKFAVHGSTLISVLEKSGKECTLKLKGSKLTVTSGHSNVDLHTLSAEEFLFTEPEDEIKIKALPLNEALMSAFKIALVSVGGDSLHPAHTGVTLTTAGNKVTMYSTDNTTLTKVNPSLLLSGRVKGSWIIPQQSVAQLLRLRTLMPDVEASLVIADSFLRAEFKTTPKVKFVSKLVEAEPENFEKILADVKASSGSEFDIPDSFDKVLSNVLTVQERELEKKCTLTVVAGKSVSIDATGPRGDVHSEMPCKETTADAKAQVNPEYVLRALPFSQHAQLNKQALVLTGESVEHLIGLF